MSLLDSDNSTSGCKTAVTGKVPPIPPMNRNDRNGRDANPRDTGRAHGRGATRGVPGTRRLNTRRERRGRLIGESVSDIELIHRGPEREEEEKRVDSRPIMTQGVKLHDVPALETEPTIEKSVKSASIADINQNTNADTLFTSIDIPKTYPGDWDKLRGSYLAKLAAADYSLQCYRDLRKTTLVSMGQCGIPVREETSILVIQELDRIFTHVPYRSDILLGTSERGVYTLSQQNHRVARLLRWAGYFRGDATAISTTMKYVYVLVALISILSILLISPLLEIINVALHVLYPTRDDDELAWISHTVLFWVLMVAWLVSVFTLTRRATRYFGVQSCFDMVGVTVETPQHRYELLDDFCVGDRDYDVPIHPRAKMVIPEEYRHKCVKHSYKMAVRIAGSTPCIPRSCIHNEISGMRKRVLVEPYTDLSKDEFSILWINAAESFANDVGTGQMPTLNPNFEHFVARYAETRRKQVSKARTDFLEHATGSVRFKNKYFVKKEVLFKTKCRIVSAKFDEYLAFTGPEYHLFQNWAEEHLFHLSSQFIFAGKASAEELGEVVHSLEEAGYGAVECDMSSYDGHTEQDSIFAEMLWYTNYLSEDVIELLFEQLVNSGRTMSGIKITCPGKFGSGGINTTFGNTIRMFMMVHSIMKLIGISEFVVLVKGDDMVLFISGTVWNKFVDASSGLKTLFKHFGHEAKLFIRGFDYDSIEFCSQRFWRTHGTRVLTDMPGRAIAKMITKDASMSDCDMDAYMRGVLHGRKYSLHVPVLGEFVSRYLASLGPGKIIKYDVPVFKTKTTKRHVRDDGTWEMFYNVYGLLESDVVAMFDDVSIGPGCSLDSEHFKHLCIVDGLSN